MGLLLSGNTYAHNEDKFIFLICEIVNYGLTSEVHIDFKKKTVRKYIRGASEEFKIYDTSERWVSAKAIDNDNKRIIIHRFVEQAIVQEFKDGKWKDISNGKYECEKINKKF